MNVKLNRVQKLLNAYLRLLKVRLEGTTKGRSLIVKGNRSRRRVVAFRMKHGRWPSRLAKNPTEKELGTRFELFVSKESGVYDPQLRRIAMITGRKTNNKRKHNVKAFKAEIIEFIQKNGRVPTTYSGQKIEGEGALRQKLDYYTREANDMTLLGEVYSLDKCHRSGIPARYRPLLNEALKDLEAPLARLPKYELEGT